MRLYALIPLYLSMGEWREGMQECHAASRNLFNKADFAAECEKMAIHGYWPVTDAGFDYAAKKNLTWSCQAKCRVHCD
ncbi:predicted protein [Plenodomus lingam JN3]|uniref:Predicted protein n=1 Tax=Leptosphaeria maculans (strain JN3 / isolate v23.1.3 / race Av1-4-5-6-7-8) TaxID=985895 RepID=E5AFK8_LEPMJ|nr:predicted protein [Plenodomus lingam JN3]CBY01997.1 predicted protein [Plenodomus lingam JN3]